MTNVENSWGNPPENLFCDGDENHLPQRTPEDRDVSLPATAEDPKANTVGENMNFVVIACNYIDGVIL